MTAMCLGDEGMVAYMKFVLHSTYSYMVVTVGCPDPSLTKQQIDDCAAECIGDSEYCIGIYLTRETCTHIYDGSDPTLNFYLYDRHQNTTIPCPTQDISAQIANDREGKFKYGCVNNGIYSSEFNSLCININGSKYVCVDIDVSNYDFLSSYSYSCTCANININKYTFVIFNAYDHHFNNVDDSNDDNNYGRPHNVNRTVSFNNCQLDLACSAPPGIQAVLSLNNLSMYLEKDDASPLNYATNSLKCVNGTWIYGIQYSVTQVGCS
ncbi:unnamed protein product, partial [Mesorhabditis spiculigera]